MKRECRKKTISKKTIQKINTLVKSGLRLRNLENNTELLKVIFIFIIDYVELNPYYELGFKRRLIIRNCTSKEQKIGYNLELDKNQKTSSTDQVS